MSLAGRAQPLWGQESRELVPPRFPVDGARWEQLRSRLLALLGPDQLLVEDGQLMAYSYDATGERHWPDLVVLPTTADQVGMVLALAREAGVPVVPRGAGTNLSGGVIPLMGGIVLGLARLNHIVHVDRDALRMVAEPGVVNEVAQRLLARDGLFYPPDPSSHRVSTLGGNVSENSGGPHCVKYGVTTNHVWGIEGFLVDGTPVALTRPEIPGYYDWAGLVTGSEGTLMCVTQMTLAIRPLPAGTLTLLASFPSPQPALDAVAELMPAVEPACLELLDQAAVQLVERFVHAGYPTEAGAVLLIEVEGDEATRAEAAQVARDLLDRQGALEVREARSQAEAEKLWLGRRAAYGALARQSAHVWVQDVTVPRPQLAAMLSEVEAIGRRHDLEVITVAHAGDGNLHPNIAFDPANRDQVERMREADREIMEACVRLDGSITGEHGIGIDKLANLALMYGAAEQDMMARMKRVFDPEWHLNPYKAILVPDAVPVPPVAPRPAWNVEQEGDVPEAVAEARQERVRLVIRGAGIRRPNPAGQVLDMRGLRGLINLDVRNQTAEVWAGTPLGELAAVLGQAGLEWPVDGWDDRETVGGVVAGALPPFRRVSSGPVRDNVLGVTVVTGEGHLVRYGRPTWKNVAGYDLTKLVVGSWGALGVITRIILKLRPRRELVWALDSLEPGEQLRRARAWLQRAEWPAALMATPKGLVTAWRDRAPREAGEPMVDPRPAWGAALRSDPGRLVWTEGVTPDRLSVGDQGWLAWPEAGEAALPRHLTRPGDVGAVIGEDVALTPLLERLRRDTRAAWDPYHIFHPGEERR
jgi:glycolate oxidase